MGIASLVLGIVCFFLAPTLGWIPFVSFIFPVISLLGLILGIIDTVRKTNTNKGIGIAGIIVCSISLLISVIMFFISGIMTLAIIAEM